MDYARIVAGRPMRTKKRMLRRTTKKVSSRSRYIKKESSPMQRPMKQQLQKSPPPRVPKNKIERFFGNLSGRFGPRERQPICDNPPPRQYRHRYSDLSKIP